jgi:hypothetical protein
VVTGWRDRVSELPSAFRQTHESAAPPALARRAVRRWLRHGDEQHPPDAATVDRVLAVARGEAVGCEVAGGRTVRRSRGRLSLGG